MEEGVYIPAGPMPGAIILLWVIHRDMRSLSERAAKDLSDLSARVSTDLRGLSDRVARLEGLLEGPIRRREPTPEAGG